MSTIPPAIALLSQLLKQKDHITPKVEVAKLRNTFSMHVKFPKDRWPEIKKSEDDPEVYAQLSKEFIDTYWSKRDDDLKDAVRGLF